MFDSILNVFSIGGGLVVIGVYIFLALFASGYLVHVLFEKLERMGQRREARRGGTGLYVNGDFMAPEELIKRAEKTSSDFKEEITEHNLNEAMRFMKSGGAVIKKASTSVD
ncbi:MAG: hypothetical protein Q7T74_02185 [Candidatus Saccharibacteria bacterium]|nr:hypothetical protein [Candidatus Saccharibacteria bacterium]